MVRPAKVRRVPAPAPAPHRPAWLLGALIVAAALLAFLPALTAGFVWDDHALVEFNPDMRRSLWAIWFDPMAEDYWPLTWSTLWLETRLFGVSAPAYHLTNVLLHASTALLLWRLLGALRVPGAWLAGLLFAVHPVTVESVAFVSEVKNVLSAVPCLVAALLWVRHLDRGRRTDLALSYLCFAAALLAKTSVVMMPFVLVAVAAQRRGRLQRADLLVAAPFFALSAGAAALTIWFQHRVAMMGEGTGRGLAERAGGAGWALWSYLERALVPVRVGIAYDPWPIGPGSLAFYLPALAAILLAGVVWRFRAPLRPVALALAFQAVMLVPVLGFVDLAFFATAPVSNHLQYLPLMGPVALLAWCLERLRQRWRHAALAAPALVVALALFTAWRASAFESDATLWVRAVQDAPDNPQVRSQLGNVRETQGRLEEAAAEFESITLRSRDEAWRRVGHMSAEYLRGHHAAAAAAAQAIVTSDANLMARRRAVAVLLATGHVDQGITVLQDLAARAPTNGEFSLLLARALRHAGRLPEAARVLDGWCRAHPGQPAFDWEYARVLLGLGDEDGARRRAASALGTRLDDPRVTALIRGAADGPR